ncbi:MAG: hypothetical protein KAJ37_04945 [Candidatus Krumholzibacteria bacterium]|nr:hypothetical protein [Candidatus Krumholzibacteria bacterium]
MIFVAHLLGCSSTQTIKKWSDASEIEKANRTLQDEKADVRFSSGAQVTGLNVNVAPDTTSWTDGSDESRHACLSTEVQEIVVTKQGKGALQGLGIGFLAGFATGFIIGTAGGGGSEFSATEAGSMFGTVLGVAGGAVGAIVGGSVGQKTSVVYPGDLRVHYDIPFDVTAEGRVIITDKVGDVIDRQERDKYGLFPEILGFESAVLYAQPHHGYVFEITYYEKYTERLKTTERATLEFAIKAMKDRIESVE